VSERQRANGIEVLAEGFQLAEAPRVAADGSVYFTDALGGGAYRWAGGELETVLPKRRGMGGMALHANGGFVVSGRDIRHIVPGEDDRVLFAAPEGVTGFNDICATAKGHLLVGGLRFLPFGGDEPTASAFWHVTAPGRAHLAIDDILWPNGVGDDGDGTFWFCDYHRGAVHRFRRGQDAATTDVPGGEADGLAFDDDGGAWVAQPRNGRLHRIAPDGSPDITLTIPDRQPTSLAFDGDTLYVTTISAGDTTGALLRLAAPVPGSRHHLATI
jgi:gluconolactonase